MKRYAIYGSSGCGRGVMPLVRQQLQPLMQLEAVDLVFVVFLFMLSITTNSMMIDMEEGHFTLLILLVFLAPKSLGLDGSKSENI